ncbi:zeta toxin family protein [Methylomonas rapida]|uniref:Zeta toxin family protein n=1 Tax=Methylomonas rapida TaxID=2963939 RepID=A0ABY7GKM8_9GAMM|nr:zeta toxin family protein [Methylomonas rapida]WAR45044.1 zeta toxin family protein [Methylomonas rapida]
MNARPSSTVKKIVIIAGPNGAGKTTFAREFLPNEAHCPVFINADLIAAGLSPFAPEAAAIKAGRLMLQSIEEHVARGDSFALETTLSGLHYARVIPQWRVAGYVVKLIFLELPNTETAIARVAARVAQGGHNIPAETILRRFESGRRNFHQTYKALVDVWLHFDNAGDQPQLLDWSES